MKRTPACLLFLLLSALFLTGCGNGSDRRGQTQYLGGFRARQETGRANFDNVSYWDGDGAHGSPSVKIDLSEQRAYFYKGGELVGVSVISTGREGHNTPTGSFKIQQKDIDHVSSLYGNYVDREGNIIKKDIDRNK